jgi:hypothetical protein
VTLEQEAPGNATGNMSKQRQDALAAVERIVFQLTKPVVVALTGGWGEGKTHFWNEVVVPSHSVKRPRYVSVFGAESLAMIRERVAMASGEPKIAAQSADAIQSAESANRGTPGEGCRSLVRKPRWPWGFAVAILAP